MSTTVAPTPAQSTAPVRPHAPKLTFGGILRSEWIKLFTLRSTFWCIVIIVLLSVGFGLLLSTVTAPHRAGEPVAAALTTAQQQAQAVSDATIGAAIGELVLAVLGVLVISGEYGTGMIRSTFAAVPKRLPALFGKAIVLAVTSLVVGLVTIYGTAAIIFPLLPGKKIHPDWTDWHLNLALIGGAVYLTLIALLAFSIGAIVRNSAGGIAAALGLILVVPSVFSIVAGTTGAAWAQNVANLLPTSAGAHLYAYATGKTETVSGILSLDRTAGGLVLLAWVVVVFIIAAVQLKRRDA